MLNCRFSFYFSVFLNSSTNKDCSLLAHLFLSYHLIYVDTMFVCLFAYLAPSLFVNNFPLLTICPWFSLTKWPHFFSDFFFELQKKLFFLLRLPLGLLTGEFVYSIRYVNIAATKYRGAVGSINFTVLYLKFFFVTILNPF